MQNQFKERFRKLNPLELVQTFNKDLGHGGWVGSRGEFLVALREEFGNRNICIDNITHSSAIRSRGFIMKKLNIMELNLLLLYDCDITLVRTLRLDVI